MKETVRLSAIHINTPGAPVEANPYSDRFDPAAPGTFISRNLEKNLKLLHQAGRNKADLVCTHECFKGEGAFLKYLDYPGVFSSAAEEIPGPTSQRLSEVARQYDMNIIANYCEKDGASIYNTSVLIDRKGGIAGKYRKVHLPPSEKWRVSEGREFTVLESDIGKIGFATCYDIIFPEHCRAVALNGADIIVHQTMGWGAGSCLNGEALVRTRAAENCVFMVVAKNKIAGDMGKSCIIDNTGNIRASAAEEEKAVFADIVPAYDLNQESHFNTLFSGVSSVKIRQALERMPSLYSVLSKEVPPLLEKHKGVELSITPDKIKGVFETWRDYAKDILNKRPVKVKYHW